MFIALFNFMQNVMLDHSCCHIYVIHAISRRVVYFSYFFTTKFLSNFSKF